jgi:hypothetical protein
MARHLDNPLAAGRLLVRADAPDRFHHLCLRSAMDVLLAKLRDSLVPQDRLRQLCIQAADEIERLRAHHSDPIDRELIDGLRAENERLRAACTKMMIGGNHVALLIDADHPPYGENNHQLALEHYGAGERFEIWCCWNAIMCARDMIEGIGPCGQQGCDG